ncbi:uncharacterized protein [Antedon mediterranea]|uniref:uncharacterized protein n=1 Tax=Antedon mediterranea TaxID=105859 RepID=UPI003AF86809
MDLLNQLTSSGDLSSTKLTIIYDTIKATKQFGILDKIKVYIPSIPNVKDIIITTFTLHQLKILKFGNVLRKEDVDKIANVYNDTPKKYTDGWGLIIDLQYRQIICEDTRKMDAFIEDLKDLELHQPMQTLTKEITLSVYLKRKASVCEDHLPPKKTLNDIPSSLQSTTTEYGSSVQRNLDKKLQSFQRTVDEILQSLQTVSEASPILRDIDGNLQSLQISTLSGNKSTVLTTIENNLLSLQRTINDNLQSLQSTITEDRSVPKRVDKKLRSLRRFLKRGQRNLSKYSPSICDFIVKLYRSEDTVTNDDEYILFQIVQLVVDLCRGYGCELKKLEHKCIIFHLVVLDPMALVNLKKMDQRGELLIRLSEILVAKEHQQTFQLDWITQIDDKKYEEALCLLEEEEQSDVVTHAPTERFPINPISAMRWAFGKVFTSGAQTSAAAAAGGGSSKHPQGTDLTMNIQEDTQGEIVESNSEKSESVSWWRRKWRSIFKRGDASNQAFGASTIAKTKKLPVSVELETGKSEDVSYRVMEELPSTLIGEGSTKSVESDNLREYVRMKWKQKQEKLAEAMEHRLQITSREKSEDVLYGKTSLGGIGDSQDFSSHPKVPSTMPDEDCIDEICTTLRRCYNYRMYDKSAFTDTDIIQSLRRSDAIEFFHRIIGQSERTEDMGRVLAHCLIITEDEHFFLVHVYLYDLCVDDDVVKGLSSELHRFNFQYNIERFSSIFGPITALFLIHLLSNAPMLQTLDLQDALTSDTLMNTVNTLSTNKVLLELDHLDMQSNDLSNIKGSSLGVLLSIAPKLTYFAISCCCLSGVIVDSMIDECVTRKLVLELEKLDIEGNDLSNIKGSSLNKLLSIAPKLRYLNMGGCNVPDDVVDNMRKHFTSVRGFFNH